MTNDASSVKRAQSAITVIKAVHSLIFLGMSAGIVHTCYAGITGRISRWTGWAIAAVIGEGSVYLLNSGRCPLTDLTERVGSVHGSVSDIFLPQWVADRVPILFSPPFAVGLIGIGLRRFREHRVTSTLALLASIPFLVVPWIFRRRDTSERPA